MTTHNDTTLETCLASRSAELELLASGAKVRCKLTGHEIPAILEKVVEYLNSKKYLKAKAGTKTKEDFDVSKYEPHIVQHSSDSKILYCTLTKQRLAKVTSVVEKHVNGRRFKEALKQHAEEAAKPKPEKRKFGKGKGKGSDKKKAKLADGETKPKTQGDDAIDGVKDQAAGETDAGKKKIKKKKVKDQAGGETDAGKTKKKKVKRHFLRRDREAEKKKDGNAAKGQKKIKMKKSPKLESPKPAGQ